MIQSDRMLTSMGAFLWAGVHHGYRKGAVYDVLWLAQDGKCLCCAGAMLPRLRFPLHKDRETLEHVIPKGCLGQDRLGNLALTHSKCNNKRGSRPPTQAELDALDVINAKLGWSRPALKPPPSTWDKAYKK